MNNLRAVYIAPSIVRINEVCLDFDDSGMFYQSSGSDYSLPQLNNLYKSSTELEESGDFLFKHICKKPVWIATSIKKCILSL